MRVICIVPLLSLLACSGKDSEPDTDTPAETDSDTDITDSDTDHDTDDTDSEPLPDTGADSGATSETGADTQDTAHTGAPETGDTALPIDTGPQGEALINEVLYNLPSTYPEGDANCDGVADRSDDEFVEIVNIGEYPLDLSGATLSDAAGVRHRFPAGTVLAPLDAIVVFGGGTPMFDGTGISGPWCATLPSSVQVVVANQGTGLVLSDTSDTVTLADRHGVVLDSVSWFGGTTSSIVRDPELVPSASWVDHQSVSSARFSPGTTTYGGAFEDHVPSPPGDTGETGDPDTSDTAVSGDTDTAPPEDTGETLRVNMSETRSPSETTEQGYGRTHHVEDPHQHRRA